MGAFDRANVKYPKCEFWALSQGVFESDKIVRIDDPEAYKITDNLFVLFKVN